MHQSVTHYSLSTVFNLLGAHLYGAEWDGYEIWGRKSVDYEPVLKARQPLEERLEETFTLILAAKSELRQALSKEDIQTINNNIANLKDEQGRIYSELHEVGEVENYSVTDRDRWERFENTESYLLRAFRNGALTVECFLGMNVKRNLWEELPKGFGYDWELSLIFMPESESAKRVCAGKIRSEEFETWLYGIVPERADVSASLPVEQQAQLWLREQVKAWDGQEKRDSFKARAKDEFTDLGERAFKRIWDQEATKEMTAPGPRKPR